MSAAKQRKAGAENDCKSFRQCVPKSMDDKAAKMLFNTLRKSMKLQEGWNLWQIAPKYDWKNLRENYVAERIYRIGQVIENDNTGLIGEIIRRGTNHLICVTSEDVMFKSWIRDVREWTEVSGVPADQRLVGTDAHREYAMRMTGTKKIKNFINKYKAKKKH